MNEDDEERHESQHEYNRFLDREIQKALLSVDDDDDDDEWQRHVIGECSPSVAGANGGPPRGGRNAPPVVAGKWTAKTYEDFDAWCPEYNRKLRKADRQQRALRSEREPAKWELGATGKDYKPKEISVSFRHYDDWRKYMVQYRKEHTYSSGPVDGKDFEPSPAKFYPCLDKCHQQNKWTPPGSARSATRTMSDTNLLELASKCKLNKTLGARCHSGDLAKADSGANVDAKPESAPEAQIVQKVDSSAATRSQHQMSAAVKIGGKGLAPLNGKTPKVSSLTASSAMAMKITPIGTAPKRLDGITQNGASNNKKTKGSTSNGYLLDKTLSLRSVNNKSPPLLLPNSQLRTVDLLCHVSTIHKQLWFDASGRAYVSLATRYDPVHK